MRMFRVVAAICLGLFLASYAAGRAKSQDLPDRRAFFSGNKVHSWCQRDRLMAQAYSTGQWDANIRSAFVVDTTFRHMAHDAAIDFALETLGGFCVTHGDAVTVDQVTDVYCIYLRNAPEKRNRSAAVLFFEAIKKAWPCKKQ